MNVETSPVLVFTISDTFTALRSKSCSSNQNFNPKAKQKNKQTIRSV